MRLLSFRDGDHVHGALHVDGWMVPLSAASRALGEAGPPLASVRDFLKRPLDARGRIGSVAYDLVASGSSDCIPFDRSRLVAPVPDPDKILCVGLNYRDHAAEAELDIPMAPMLFAKFRNSLVGPDEDVIMPAVTAQVDYEGELAVVIGTRARDLTEEQAMDAVAGVMPLNDVSARDLQSQTTQFTAGKAIDTFAPCGPELVTLDEVGEVGNLKIVTRVNGQVVQDGCTSEMIFPVPTLLAFISSFLTLEPGDIIATGTPAGVGFKRDPQLLLQQGDVVEVEIDGIGATRNPVRASVA